MNTQHKTQISRLPQSSSRGSKAVLGMGALAIIAGASWRAVGNADSPKVSATGNKAAASASQYRPSEFSGVQVRSIPQKQKAAGKSADWVYVKPGTRLPAAGVGPMTNGGGARRIVAGRSRVGGKALYLPESSMPLSSAKIAANGRVVLKCDRNGKPHSTVEHAKHTRRATQVQKLQPR